MDNALLVQQFVEQIWNSRVFEKIDNFLHPDFKDYSLPPTFPANREGTKKWILNTGLSFEHHTIIEQQVTEAGQSIIKIRMDLRHTGAWRGIEPTGIALHTSGYRHFSMKDGKIIAHWSVIDGQAIENQLKNAAHGCKPAD